MALPENHIKVPSVQISIRQTEAWENDRLPFAVCSDSEVRHLDPDMVLVKTVAVAINPYDYKMPTQFHSPRTTPGVDFAGIVVCKGSAVSASIEVGSRVCGMVGGSNPGDELMGAFGQYVPAYEHALLRIPKSVSWENAAALPSAVITIGASLFSSSGLGLSVNPESPAQDPFFVLVYGGSTCCGTMAIQLLKQSGLTVVTTCSPGNFSLVKSYGADEVFDYHSPTCAEDIKAYTKNRLKYVLDVITQARTTQICYSAIGRAGGRYIGLELINKSFTSGLRRTVDAGWINSLTFLGREVCLAEGYESKARPDHQAFTKKWLTTAQNLLDNGSLRSHPPRVMPNGFEAVIDSVERIRRQEVSGQKLVHFI
ncbi:chaperonin 10-like protein [Talaromyces proteolyticus]|uniref:Chaperonin 10-like protein n=1 Tax=Talaromyces proteolyticus TaxID=1131652 RepID=A0AAD4KCW8_9EURO|nr:chaperonin 10-like protein [Talaromyces proteolyticus]KAH8688607.1 chaperonin 10-like protein [Talaromyces proteolyticus]